MLGLGADDLLYAGEATVFQPVLKFGVILYRQEQAINRLHQNKRIE
jgi:hypothetical protein